MSYAEAKEIALLRMQLRSSWLAGDGAGARSALARLTQLAELPGGDPDLAAEVRRWMVKLVA